MYPVEHQRKFLFHDLAVPMILAGVQLVVQVAFHGNYGYFRDELYYIACSNHLAFGYVDQPPLSIALLAVVRGIFGDSLYAIRFLSAAAVSVVMLLGALMTRRLGGGKGAQALTSLTIMMAPGLLGMGHYFSMNSFDVLFWTLGAYLLMTIFISDQPKYWVLFGICTGLGLLNKYSIGFLCLGLVAGLLLSSQRKHLINGWFWLGVLMTVLLTLPHLTWEIQNHYPSIEFMRNASELKNVKISVPAFFFGQFRDMNYVSAPIWLLGLGYFLFHPEGKKVRALGWIYVTVLFIMVFGNAKVYYLAPIYPMMFAGGLVFTEKIIRRYTLSWPEPVYAALLVAMGFITLPFTVPVLPVETFIRYEQALGVVPHAEERSAVGVLPQYYADEFGWREMVDSIGTAYKSLQPEERAQCVIYARNYGEAGAIDFFGNKYGLPHALCAHNNYWFWGPGDRSGNVALIFGSAGTVEEPEVDLRKYYREVKLVTRTHSVFGMPYENGRPIFLCKGMSTTFQHIWPTEHLFI
ncbi:MAG TPA: glycosyltransferase family 39 protein [Bacteroidota bacterium]|nr:glycosyltransferase family 39 protein [Bacteroidota bacterium]